MKVKKLLALLLTLVMLVGLIPAIPASAEEIVLDEEAAPMQEIFTVVGEDYESDVAGISAPEDPYAILNNDHSQADDAEVNAHEQAGSFANPEDLPYYAQQSRELLGARTVYIKHHEELRQYLYDDTQPYNIVLAANLDARGDGNYAVWAPVRGIKSLNLKGHTIYLANDDAAESTMFHVQNGAYLEVYDSKGGSWVNYDGYIHDEGRAQYRNLFLVDGTLIFNSGTLEAGRSKKGWADEWHEGIPFKVWKQVVGTGVKVNDGIFIMNGGSVYGRGRYPTDSNNIFGCRGHANINGGTVGGFGGADPLSGSQTVRGGYFFTSKYNGFAGINNQGEFMDWSEDYYGRLYIWELPYCTKTGQTETSVSVVTDGGRTIDALDTQTVKGASPIITVGKVKRMYPEMKGVYCLGTLDATFSAFNQLQYNWEIKVGNTWVNADDHTSPDINVKTAWASQGFVPEAGEVYHARCTVREQINDLSYQTIYTDVPFMIDAGPVPKIVKQWPDAGDVSFRAGDTILLRADAACEDDVTFQWEVTVDGSGLSWSDYPDANEPGGWFLRNLNANWNGVMFRCRLSNENGSAWTEPFTLRYDDGIVESVEFVTGTYQLYEEPYAPTGYQALTTDVTCLTNGVTLENIEWQGHQDAEIKVKPITATWPGQKPTLILTFRFNKGVFPATGNAGELNVTLDGLPFTGYKNIVDDGKGIVATYYWSFPPTPSDGAENEISKVSILTRASVGVGYYTTDVIEDAVGYEEYGDADVRYEVTGERWECDGMEMETGDKFLAYANHKLTAYLSPAPGWRFTAGTVVMFEGEKCDARLLSDGTLVCSRSYYVTDEDDDDFENHDVVIDDYGKVSTENLGDVTDDGGSFSYEDESWKELIDYVSLSGPEVDEYHSAGYILQDDLGYGDELSFDARYAIEEYRWFRDGVEIPDDTPFEAEHEYDLMIVLRPNSGYKFFHDCLVEYNGNWVKAIRLEDGTMEVDASWYIEDNGQGLQSNSFFMARYGDRLRNGEYAPAAENFGTLTINRDYTTENTAIRNSEDGLVIYLEKDVTITYTGDGSALVLNGDTTITGPGRLTINATRTTAPAIAVNGARLSIRDAQLTINAPAGSGICGYTVDGNRPELEIEYSALTLNTASGAIYDILGNMGLTDCRVTEPSLHMGSTLGILYPVSGYNPVENVVIIPERAVQSISIGGLSAVETSLVMEGGQTRQLTAIISPADAAMQEVTWSADTNNVKVSPDGLVTAYKVGNATVTASCGGMRASIGVAVTSNDVDVASFDLIPHEITVGVGQTAALRPQVLPLNASNPSGFWYVYNNDPHVALVGDTTEVDLNEATVVVRGAAAGDADVIVFSNGYADAASCTVHVVENYTPAENVTVSTGVGRSLRVGDTATLTATVTPAAATDKTVMWTSSDPDVVTVDQSGNITVAGVGEATVTAEIWNGSALVSSSVDITVPYPVLGVGISAPRNVLYVGGSVQLEAYVYPGNAADRSVIWTSSDEEIATVDANGVVTGVGTWESESASVTITCTTADGGFTDSVGITVNQPPTRVQSLTLSQNELTMPVSGDKSSQRIYIKILPENADETAWTCTVSSPLATASIVHLEDADHNFISGTEPLYGEYCYVVADLTGTANLTFRSVDGGKVARLRVKVVDTDDYIPVESVEVEGFITLGVGQSVSVLPTIEPVNASEKTVLLTSGDLYGEYIRVEDGRIYGVSEGYADVMVTVDGVSTRANGLPAVCNIHVVKPVETLTLDAQVVALPLGGTQRLTAAVGPDDAYDKTVTWTSADESVVTVDPDGTLHAVGYGTTYITAETAIFPLSAGCTVTVISNTYDLYIDGTQITDENRVGDNYTYDPSANILTVSGGITSEGGAPAIRSEIDGLTVAFTGEPSLSAAQSALWLEANTTVTGTATLRSTGAVPVYVSNGAALTLDGADLTVIGPSGIHATGTGESLTVINTGLSVSGIVEALGGFDGGITLSGCVLLNGCRVADGGIVTAAGGIANSALIVPTPACGEPDFTLPAMIRTIEDGAFEGTDAEIVYIPDGCTSIGQGAFRNCPSLTQIRIPAGCAIGEGAFDGCGTVYVFAPADSPAQTFCEDPANPNCIFIAE